MTPASTTTAPMATGDWTRALFEAIDDAVFVHDLEGHILEANPAACRRLGYTRDEFLHLTTRDIDDAEFAEGFADRLRTQLSKGRFRCEGRHRTKDGRIIPVDINTSAVHLHGRPAVLAVIRDITQQKLTEETLARQTDLLTSILNNMADAVLVADTERRLLSFNPAAQRLFGLQSAAKILGQPLDPRGCHLADRVTPFPRELFPLNRALRGEEIGEVEMFVKRDAGPGVWVSVSGQPLRDSSGVVKGGMIVCHDFTERRRADGRLTAQYAVARALAEESGSIQSTQRILRILCEALGLDAGILWLVQSTENCLRCVQTWQQPSLEAPRFLEACRRIALDLDRDGPGLAWATNRHVAWVFGLQPLPLRCDLGRQEGLQASYSFPIQGNAGVLGVIELLARSPAADDEDLLSLVEAVCRQMGQVLERQRVEQALRDSEALYHSLVQSLPQNIFRKDSSGRVTFANKHYCETLNLPLEELLGKTDFDLFPPELAAKYVEDDRKVLEANRMFETVEKHHLPDGRTIYVQVVKTPVYDAQGAIIGIQGIFWDVTESTRAAEILTESERRYRQLTEATLDGILLVDSDEIVRLFNPAAERMFGYRADEVIGKPAAMLVPVENRTADGKGFFSYLEASQSQIIGRTTEVRALRKDGAEFPAELALSLVTMGGLDGSTAESQFLCAVRDLTERNKMRSVLVQNEKLASIGLLSAGVAHEINNPLAFVANNLVVLERDTRGLLSLIEQLDVAKEKLARLDPAWVDQVKDLEEQLDIGYTKENLGRLLQRTRDGVERVSRIVHSLRGLARTDAPRLQETSIPDLIDGSLEILHGRYKRSGIVVEQEHDPAPRIRCVQTQINQVFLNLLVNAFQAVEAHRKEGGKIAIRSRRTTDEMIIEVQDNGHGISAEQMSRVFDPFFTTKDVGEGTGLGLSISHNIVTAHGGRIEVESEPGHGALFRVHLPLKSPKERP